MVVLMTKTLTILKALLLENMEFLKASPGVITVGVLDVIVY
jgi:hypothetical protein